MRTFTISLSLLFVIFKSLAQTGSWSPTGADLSYPRTLLKVADVAAVQSALAQSYALYNGLYQSINTMPPGGNTTSDERRIRATFAKNTAFVVLMNRQPIAGSLTTLDPALRDTFIANCKSLLENINPKVEVFATISGTTPYTEWQWRSKELIDYMIAYDLLRGAGESEVSLATAQKMLQNFAGYLHYKSNNPFLGVVFYNQVKNNHNLMTAAALGLSAVVLNHVTSDSTYKRPANWINTGMYHLDNVLWRDAQRQSDSATIAGYAEGPYYFKYAFLNCLPFIRSMGNFLPDGRLPYTYNTTTRSIRNPFYDPKYELLYQWMSAIIMPDGRFPALEDSYIDMGMPELVLTGKSKYSHTLHLKNLASTQLNSLTAQLRDATVDMRAAYLAANVTPTEPANNALTLLPQSGNLIFRSGNDSLATYLHVYGKSGKAQTNSGGHSHADAGSFILHAKGQLLALDPGYLSFSRRGETGNATNHNMLLVNGAGPAIGTSGNPNDALATVQKAFKTTALSYGEVQTSYQNVAITRKTLFVRNTYYIMADFISATDGIAKDFTWQLHGYGLENGNNNTGTFTDNLIGHEGTWQKNGINLKAHVTATDGATTYSKATNPHELHYNETENHTTLLAHKKSVTATQFISVLFPFIINSATVATTFNPGTAALNSADTGFKDIAWAKTETTSDFITDNSGTLPQAVGSDANFTFYSYNPDEAAFAQAFVEGGKLLKYGSDTVLESTERATVSWQKITESNYEGYVNRQTILTLALPDAPAVVTGTGITSYTYNTVSQSIAISFSEPSAFTITTEPTVLPVTLIHFRAMRKSGKVQLNWVTATEQNNKGFTILRRTDVEPVFESIGFVAGQGNSQIRHSYSFDDDKSPSGTCYYQLRQTDFNDAVAYSPVVPVNGQKISSQLQVGPNPASDFLRVYFSNPQIEVVVLVHSVDGQLVKQQKFSRQVVMDINILPPGLYFVSIIAGNKQLISETHRIVISR